VQAVVVSIDPKRVYVKDPSEVPYKTVEVQQPGIYSYRMFVRFYVFSI
jgi:hypothetical protein